MEIAIRSRFQMHAATRRVQRRTLLVQREKHGGDPVDTSTAPCWSGRDGKRKVSVLIERYHHAVG